VNYKTLPDSSTNKIKMAVGGDIGMTPDAKTLTNYLINENPDVIIIGGDTAYDNAMRTCYYSWDNFYNIFEDLNKKLNRIVPIILTVGNHDVGFDAFATVEIDRNE
jgi:metallophosphoesterase superfamily enzyme